MFSISVPTATILGGPDLHVDKGSTINLTCSVKYSPDPPAYIFWYHHDEVSNPIHPTTYIICVLFAIITNHNYGQLELY